MLVRFTPKQLEKLEVFLKNTRVRGWDMAIFQEIITAIKNPIDEKEIGYSGPKIYKPNKNSGDRIITNVNKLVAKEPVDAKPSEFQEMAKEAFIERDEQVDVVNEAPIISEEESKGEIPFNHDPDDIDVSQFPAESQTIEDCDDTDTDDIHTDSVNENIKTEAAPNDGQDPQGDPVDLDSVGIFGVIDRRSDKSIPLIETRPVKPKKSKWKTTIVPKQTQSPVDNSQSETPVNNKDDYY